MADEQEKAPGVVVPPATFVKLLNYLGGRPFVEVAQLITELQQLAKAQQQPPPG